MMWPPSIIRLRIVDNGRKKIRLWLPLFLIWPLVLVLATGLLPIVLLVTLIGWGPGKVKAVVQAGAALCSAVCYLRGLTVEVRGEGDEVLVSVR